MSLRSEIEYYAKDGKRKGDPELSTRSFSKEPARGGIDHTTTRHRDVKKHLELLGLDTGQDEFYKSELVISKDSKGIWERSEVHY